MAVGKLRRDLDPLPALDAERLRLAGQLLDDEPVEQCRILQPAAIVLLEEIAHDDTAGRLVDVDADELRPLVGSVDGAFGKVAAEAMGLLFVSSEEQTAEL